MRIANIAVLFMIVLGSACSSGDDSKDKDYSVTFSENPVRVDIEGGVFTVSVSASHEWRTSSDNAWISSITPSGVGKGTVSFSVEPTSLNAFREGTISFSSPDASSSTQLTVRQIGRMTVTPPSLNFGAEGGTQTLTVDGADGWQIDPASDAWINVTRENTLLTVRVEPNFSGAALAGKIILKGAEDNSGYTVPVTQDFDSTLFFGATTPIGRRFVYGNDGWVQVVTSDKQYAINEQVSVLEITYIGPAAEPYRVFLFDLRLENGTTIRVTTADDENSSIKATAAEITKLQIIREQLAAMQNKRSATYEVLAGVNGGFADPDSVEHLLRGVIYRGGVCLKGTFIATKPDRQNVFALMRDGTARIMSEAQYAVEDKNEIYEAVTGMQAILSEGVDASETAIDRNDILPRTAVGIPKQGNRVVLLIVDGRQPGSVGATYSMMAKMFLAMGAYDAVNLDGGWSSTFAIKRLNTLPATADSFETLNTPCSINNCPGDRPVTNGIAIVKQNT